MAVLVFNYFAADYTVMYNYREFYEALGSNMKTGTLVWRGGGLFKRVLLLFW